MLTKTESEVVKAAFAEALATASKPLVWEKRLSEILWINSVAISHDGNRVVGGTFLHDYRQRTGKFQPNIQSRFGTFCFDHTPPTDGKSASALPLWSDEFDGWDGIFGVAVSGDGSVAASGGWLEKAGNSVAGSMAWGVIRAYNAVDGTRLLDYTNLNQRANWVALSHDGNVLAAVADDVYVFVRQGKTFSSIPLKLGISITANRYVTGLALHPSGTWLAACDQTGRVYAATIRNDGFAEKLTWKAPATIPFLSVAIAAKTETFVAGGGNSLFLFSLDAMRHRRDPIAFDTTVDQKPETIPPNKPDGRIQENVRWAAISADGTLVSVVANRNEGDKGTGVLLALRPDGDRLTRVWYQQLENNPNSTSIDADGRYIAASDGYPTIKPAKFYLFDAKDGAKRWDFQTNSMNWPLVISGNGTAIAGGSDDGTVYYFRP
jgi:WD40 repeat protein